MSGGDTTFSEDIKEMFLIHREYHANGCNVRGHMHRHIEILYCFDGEYRIMINGSEYIFSGGDMIVVNAMEVHSITSVKDGGSYICLRFKPELIYTTETSGVDMKYVLPFTLNNTEHTKLFKREELSNTNIPQMINETYNEFTDKEYGYEIAVRTSVARLFLWIIRYWNSHNETKISDFEPMHNDMMSCLEKALVYVNDNYADDIKAVDVAAICSMSYSYFTRIFKRYMKKSFSEYLCYVRITNAEKLLTTTQMTVTDIALSSGFSCSSYFIKIFREMKGMSPKRYRDMYLR